MYSLLACRFGEMSGFAEFSDLLGEIWRMSAWIEGDDVETGSERRVQTRKHVLIRKLIKEWNNDDPFISGAKHGRVPVTPDSTYLGLIQ